MTTDDNRSRLLRTQEVADMLGVPESTVRYWRHVGKGPRGFRIGRRVVYRLDAVDAWLREQERQEHDDK